MALAFAARSIRQRWVGQGKKNIVTDVTLDASYVNGTGYAITKAQLGFGAGDTIDFVDIQPPHGGFVYTVSITATGIVLRVWLSAAAAAAFQEAANNQAGLNGLVLRLLVVGN